MTLKHLIKLTLITASLALNSIQIAIGDEVIIKPFQTGSYQQLLTLHHEKAFILAIWSIDCPSCLKDFAQLSQLHKAHPELDIVLLATDETEALPDIRQIVSNHQLSNLENWAFMTNNPEKLRYEIDPAWYGELPRTYFFNAQHQRQAQSGALPLATFEAMINSMK